MQTGSLIADETRSNVFDGLITAILVLLVVLPPLALGSVSPWARSVLFLAALLLLGLWLLGAARQGRLSIVRTPAWWFILAVLGVAGVQLVPLPPAVLELLSPLTSTTYERTLPGYPESGPWRTLSLCPYATGSALVRMATLAIVFFVVVNSVRTRWQVLALVIALLAVGTFETLYGLAEQFSGHKHIFHIPRLYHLNAVAGTYHNKNHFAGLLEMIVPVCLGLLLALSRRATTASANRGPGPRAGVRLAHALSSPGAAKQVLLAGLAVVMTVTIGLSLSRAGILCTGASLVALMVLLGISAGFRRYTLLLLLIVATILAVGTAVGMELIVARMEEALGHSTSWIDRMDLASGALDYIRDFPLMGSGLGTFGLVFPRYQSARFGDRWADFLHDDWLQAFCEMGFLGGLLFVIGALVVVAAILRMILARRDPFCRWLATGCLLGVAAMLLHSFFDYNLAKITANAVVFSIIVGLALTTAGMPGRRRRSTGALQYWHVSLRSAPARGIVVAAAVAVVAAWAVLPFTSIMADVHYNGYLSSIGRSDPYFFLSPENGDENRDLLAEADALDPGNPVILFYRSQQAIQQANDKVYDRAVAEARSLVGPALEGADPQGFQRVVVALATRLRPRMRAEREPLLRQAAGFLTQAIQAAPTVAKHHADLGDVLRSLEPGSAQIVRSITTAVWLASRSPANLFKAGRILLTQAGQPPNAQMLARAKECFRRTLFSDPKAAYAERIYRLARKHMGGHQAMLDVTPRSLRAYEKLSQVLWQSRDWEGVLACLDTIEQLADSRRTDLSDAEDLPQIEDRATDWADEPPERLLRGATAYDTRSPDDIRRSVAQRRCEVLGLMGRWKARTEAIVQYRRLLRRMLEPLLAEADRLRRSGMFAQAVRVLQNVLYQDWSEPQALLQAADLASLPHVADAVPGASSTLDHLYRLVVYSVDPVHSSLSAPTLSAKHYDRALEILGDCAISGPDEQLVADFVRAAGAVVAGRAADGRPALRALARRTDEAFSAWRQRHLVWYVLGLAYERLGQKAKAVAAYRRVLTIVPTHRPALVRLKALGQHVTRQLRSVSPPVTCGISFGGKAVLLGYQLADKTGASAHRASPDAPSVSGVLTCWWQFTDTMPADSFAHVELLSDEFKVLARRNLYFSADGDEPYPVDLARYGEVIVERQRLKEDLSDVAYVRFQIRQTDPHRYFRLLRNDGNADAGVVPAAAAGM